MLKSVLLGSLACNLIEVLKNKLTSPYELVARQNNVDPREAAELDVLVTAKFNGAMPLMPKLKLLQIPLAGTDLVALEAVPPGSVVCNTFGHELAVAEYVIMAMLVWCHRLIDAHTSFQAGSWQHSSRANGQLHEELSGKTLGILGFGRVGRAVASMAKAFGITVIACNRSPFIYPVSADEVIAWDDMDTMLSQADFILVACALTPQTDGIIDARRLAVVKQNAVIINIARGECVDEDDLFEACAQKRIGGAVIDVWYRYPSKELPLPRPSRRPFHILPNVIMTPHSSSWTTGMIERRVSQIAENMDRLAAGIPLLNIVREPINY